MPPRNEFFRIAPHCSLKRLEEPYLYDIANDELYELDTEGFDFLTRCSQGERPPTLKEDEEFIRCALQENLITLSRDPGPKRKLPRPSPLPSLRYLELQITGRCNLRCRHCYLGESSNQDLSLDRIRKVLSEFETMQGLRLLLSGGEPLTHPRFWELNDLLPTFEFRTVLLSNGALVTEKIASKLRVHEVQISLDGLKKGHEVLRGEGTFEKTVSAIDLLGEARIRVSVATMIHRGNLNEFEGLAELIRSKEIKEWNIDQPCFDGRLKENKNFLVPPSEAGRYLQFGFGGGLHISGKDSACGAHLCAVFPDGKVAKCGLFQGEPVGSIDEGLRACWERLPRILLTDLECRCSIIDECRGGCRFRAISDGGLLKPDLFQCYARGVLKGGERT